MTNQLQDRIRTAIERRRERGLLRRLQSPRFTACDFSSNDYLGFARPGPFQDFLADLKTTGDAVTASGATGSRLLSGHSAEIDILETEASRFHGSEAALLFNSGYDANLSVLSCIPGSNDAIVYDELIHASVHDGMRMSRARSNLFLFRHNDVASLEDMIKEATSTCSGTIIICIETVYSMDGDVCPVRKILQLIATLRGNLQREIYLIADEAHAVGLYGPNGEGLVSSLGMHRNQNLLLRVVTYGKAFAAHGAIVLADHSVRTYLINYARPFIYSTALPPHSIWVLQAAYKFAKTAEAASARKALWDLVESFDELTKQLLPSKAVLRQQGNSPIKGILVPGNRACVQVANMLRNRGYDVYPIRSPTVRPGSERIRVIVHAHNTNDEIRRLILSTAQALEDLAPRSRL